MSVAGGRDGAAAPGPEAADDVSTGGLLSLDDSRPALITVQPVAADADGAYALFEVAVPAGAGLAPHLAARHEATVIVLAGEIEVVLAGERRLLGAGSHLRLQRGRPRRGAAVSDARLLCLSVPAGLELLAEAHADPDADPDDLAALLTDHGVTVLPSGWGEPVR